MNESSSMYKTINQKPRSKKLKPRIDLTAMVSVSFLLIIFFMVTEELSKPKMMELGLPATDVEDGCYFGGCGGNPDRIVTILLDDKDKIISYQGLLEIPIEKPKTYDYGKNGIRQELLKKNKAIKDALTLNGINKRKGLIVIIKPSKKSSFKNLVDILDEMAITNIDTYSIINDYAPEEQKLLASN
jgi:biopolymer transport protein ExbD